VQETYALVLC